MKDSDEDGKTNGEELGDPNCTWSRDSGLLPEKIDGLSHPGQATFISLSVNIPCVHAWEHI